MTFEVEIESDLPPSIVADEQRLNQILKNLLSNAFKFTHQGGVRLAIGFPGPATNLRSETLQAAENVIAFTVVDTGVGIADDKLGAIFEAFQQADGTTSRKYGGTGLGLSISREIARLLGGEIQVTSRLGQGSRFALYLPMAERAVDAPQPDDPDVGAPAILAHPVTTVPARVDAAQPDGDERALLVIDPDGARARAVLDAARAKGVRAIVARRASAALGVAREHRPSAVLLAGDPSRVDAALGQLKKHPDTRHLPVLAISDPAIRLSTLRSGAAAFVDEPVRAVELEAAIDRLTRITMDPCRRIAVIATDGELEALLRDLLSGSEHVELERLEPERAPSALHAGRHDLAVVALDEDRAAAMTLLQEVATDDVIRELPVVVYVGVPMPRAFRARLDAIAKSAVMSVADSPEWLAERLALFMHRLEATLPTSTRKMLGRLRSGDAPLHGKKVLVIDDDIRNVFALTSTLEQRGMKVVFAENGREGIERLHQHPNTDLVLLDIMMPEMDGYETARAIRAMARFEHLPIISLTAKAMRDDREKALDAGASDYITKPVDLDHLVSMMRVWLDA